MPLSDYKCKGCELVQERFYTNHRPAPVCEDCGGELEKLPLSRTATNLRTGAFPFVTPHINGKPIEVTDLGHVRRLEKQYGVVLTAFSNDPGNYNDGIRDLPTYRGDTPYDRHRD